MGRVTDLLPYRASPAYSAYTTVEDLWRFALALTGHQLLDARHTALVTTGRGTIGWEARRFGYGFFEEVIGGIRVFGHDGASPGMSGDFLIWPDTGHISAVLANMDPPTANEVSKFIYARLPLIPVGRSS